AHPKIDHHTGELFNFGVSFSKTHPALNLFRFFRDGRLVFRKRIPLPYPASMHDFAISRTYGVFYVSPLVLDMTLVQQGSTIIDALSWQPQRGSRLIVASRATGDVVADIDAGRQYCLHLVNAFEGDDDRLVIDLIEFDKPLYPE